MVRTSSLLAAAALLASSTAHAQFLYQAAYGSGTAADGSIYTYTDTGAKSTFATGLQGPFGLAFNSSDNLFVTANNSNGTGVIYKYTTGGMRTTFVSSIPQLLDPGYIAFDSSGDMYAAYAGNSPNGGGILKIAPNGTYTQFATGLSYAYGIAVDASNNIYVNSNDGNVYKYTPGGAKSTFFSYSTGLGGMEFDPATGNLIAADTNDNEIIDIAANGSGYTVIGSLPHGPNDVAIDASGDIFAVDDFAQVVYEYPDGGSQETFHDGGTLNAIGLAIYNPEVQGGASTPEPGSLALFAALGTGITLGVLRRKRLCI